MSRQSLPAIPVFLMTAGPLLAIGAWLFLPDAQVALRIAAELAGAGMLAAGLLHHARG